MMVGCFGLNRVKIPYPKYDKGSDAKVIGKAADKQESATNDIDSAVEKTIANADNPPVVVKEQNKITTANRTLKENISILRQEAETKGHWENERVSLFSQIKNSKKAYVAMEKERDEYKKRFDGVMGKLLKLFIILGGIAVPLGILATFKLADPSYLWLSAAGVLLILSVNVIGWIQDHWEVIVLTIVGAALAFAYRMYSTGRRSFRKQIKITEQLKEEVKALPVEDADETSDTSKNPKLILKKIFGDKHTDGEAGLGMDDITRKRIINERKNLEREWTRVVQ
jgi:hypothetical protein